MVVDVVHVICKYGKQLRVTKTEDGTGGKWTMFTSFHNMTDFIILRWYNEEPCLDGVTEWS